MQFCTCRQGRASSLGPCHHGMARPLVADERPPKWRVAGNILNKQSRAADKGWSSNLWEGDWERC